MSEQKSLMGIWKITQKALPSVPKLEVLILELRSVDRLSSSP